MEKIFSGNREEPKEKAHWFGMNKLEEKEAFLNNNNGLLPVIGASKAVSRKPRVRNLEYLDRSPYGRGKLRVVSVA